MLKGDHSFRDYKDIVFLKESRAREAASKRFRGTLPPADLHAVQRIADSHVVPDEKAEEWCMLKQIDPI